MNSVAESVRKAAVRLEAPGAWTQKVFARAQDGRSLINGYDLGACQWCFLGALEHELCRTPGYWPDPLVVALDKLFPCEIDNVEAGELDELIEKVSIWNDAQGRTQAEVVARLRQVADLVERAE